MTALTNAHERALRAAKEALIESGLFTGAAIAAYLREMAAAGYYVASRADLAAAVAKAVADEREACAQLTLIVSARWQDEPGDSALDCHQGIGYRLACDALAAAIRARKDQP